MEKLKVLLVDDDRIVIEDLRSLIDWNALGLRIIGAAFDGKRALTLFKQHQPHIVITDIIMPHMNGIELISEIQTLAPETVFLILSSYDEFSYAKEALRMGVYDYLLKMEMTQKQLTGIMQSTYRFIAEKKRSHSNHLRLELQEYMLHSDETVTESSSLHSIRTKKFFFCIIFDLTVHKRFCLSHQSSLQYNAKALEDIITYSLEDTGKQRPLLFVKESFLILGLPHSQTTNVPIYLNTLFSNIEKERHLSLYFAYYPESLTISTWRNYYHAHKNYLQYSCFFPPAPIFALEKKALLPSYSNFSEQLNSTHVLEDLLELATNIDAAFDLENFIHLFCYVCRLNFKDSYLEICKFDSFETYLLWLKSEYHAWTSDKKESSEYTYSAHTKLAINYIEQHYFNCDLSIEQIAENIGISSGRLSVLFKRDTQQTLNEYLTHQRIAKATQLLINSNYKIYEIAEMVGYRSSQYFSQIFLSKTQKKPLDYRKNSLIHYTLGEIPNERFHK